MRATICLSAGSVGNSLNAGSECAKHRASHFEVRARERWHGEARTVVPRDVRAAVGLMPTSGLGLGFPFLVLPSTACLTEPPARALCRLTAILGTTTFNFLTSVHIVLQAQHINIILCISFPFKKTVFKRAMAQHRVECGRNAEADAHTHVCTPQC